MDALSIFSLIGGLVLLVSGAELLVRGASNIAKLLGIPPLLIGLTIVSIGTSTPELAVSVQAALDGSPGIALGNVVGSNIANVLLILGVAAAITPLVVQRQLIWYDQPVMILVSIAVMVMAFDGSISRLDGLLLLLGAVVYIWVLIRLSKRQPEQPEEKAGLLRRGWKGWLLYTFFFAIGLGLLVAGSELLITGAVKMAHYFGISDLIIGLTVVAVGTSLPEVATSIIASIRRQPDIAVGNVIGSNILNILIILGASAAIPDLGIAVPGPALAFDIPVMIAVAVLCLPIIFTERLITRLEGMIFMGFYVAYVVFLVLQSGRHASLPLFSNIMMFGVFPLTALGLIVGTVATIKAKKKKLEAITPPLS